MFHDARNVIRRCQKDYGTKGFKILIFTIFIYFGIFYQWRLFQSNELLSLPSLSDTYIGKYRISSGNFHYQGHT